jgi:hypothetical protein
MWPKAAAFGGVAIVKWMGLKPDIGNPAPRSSQTEAYPPALSCAKHRGDSWEFPSLLPSSANSQKIRN